MVTSLGSQQGDKEEKKKKVVFSLLPQKQSLKWSFLGKPFIKGMHTERKQEKKGK